MPCHVVRVEHVPTGCCYAVGSVLGPRGYNSEGDMAALALLGARSRHTTREAAHKFHRVRWYVQYTTCK